jgi:hypothetical protein
MDARARRLCFWTASVSLVVAAIAEGCVGTESASDPIGEQPDASVDGAPPQSEASPDAAPASDAALDTSSPVDASDGGADAAAVTVELFGAFDGGANNGTAQPINTFYQTKKIQWLVLAADLTAAGIPQNAKIDAIELQASAVPGRAIDAFRIGLANTTTAADGVTAFPRPFYGATTLVYGPVNEPTTRWTVGAWTTFPLATPFVCTAGSNLLVETSFTLAVDAVVGGGLLSRTTGRTNTLVRYYVHAAAPVHPYTGTNAINGGDEVPAMRVTYRP